jgi:hypothetical protein
MSKQKELKIGTQAVVAVWDSPFGAYWPSPACQFRDDGSCTCTMVARTAHLGRVYVNRPPDMLGVSPHDLLVLEFLAFNDDETATLWRLVDEESNAG